MELRLTPFDEKLFKEELIKNKIAVRILRYNDGHIVINLWNAYKFTDSSDLMNNIKTQDWYRNDKNIIDMAEIIVLPMADKMTPKPITGKADPYTPPRRGCDERTEHVYYNDNVNENEQVPGLCKTIECMYERILGFARNVFEEVHELREIRRIPIILKKECPTKTYYNSDEYIAQKLNEISKERGQITAQDVARVSRKTDRIAGQFCQNNGDPYIVIYYRQFNANTWEEYIAMIANTLAHEYAHYLEYSYCPRSPRKQKNFKGSCVSEAIADFFGVLFSINRVNNEDLQVAINRYESWVEWFGSAWPYANALYFVKNMPYPLHTDLNDYDRYRNIEKLIRVFCLTPDTDAAYNELTH